MLAGMSATATITTSSSEDTLTIPAAAVHQKGGKSYVYTSEDEDGNLSGETEIETGMSTDSTIEVTSGLTEGETVYYTELSGSTISSSTDSNSQQMMGGMPSGDMGGGGGMPSGGGNGGGNGGGGMPSGGGQGRN